MRKVILYLIPILILVNACTSGINNSGKKLIVCTTGYAADLVRSVVGDSAEVIALMGPGVDPHLYKASLRDVDYLTEADLIVYSGLHLEGKMTEILEKITASKKVICLSEGLTRKDFLFLPGAMGTPDPHFWFDVSLWKKAALWFSKEYNNLSWTETDYILSNTRDFEIRLDQLHQKTLVEINSIPEAQRTLVTAHDAFGYFSRAYGIRVRALQGISTQSEYGLRDITELQNFLIQNNIPTIFVESSVPKKSIDAVVAGCRSKGFKINIGRELYSDALGDQESGHNTFEKVVEYNVTSITEGLKGNPKYLK